MQRVQGDLADLGLALLDVAAQQRLALIRLALDDRAQDLRMILIGSPNAIGKGEREASPDL
ncbi:hypothetical protein H4F44_23800, partial [Escherichia coli]|nr:hypothetical protein [Escherichia coli]